MKTCIIAAIGTLLRASGKTMAMLSMARIPAAAPRVCGVTELMMALVLGETNRPEPPPMRTMNTASIQYGVDGPIVESPSNASEEIPRPRGARTREPTRSESRPLRGPTTIKAAPKGISNNPAASGFCPYGPCRKKIRRNKTAPRATPFNRPLKFASAKRRSRRSRSCTIGSLIRGSISPKSTRLTTPTARITILAVCPNIGKANRLNASKTPVRPMVSAALPYQSMCWCPARRTGSRRRQMPHSAPKIANGTLKRNTQRQDHSVNRPPMIGPTRKPAAPAIWLTPSPRPTCPFLKASATMAVLFVGYEQRAAHALYYASHDQVGTMELWLRQATNQRTKRKQRKAAIVEAFAPPYVCQASNDRCQNGGDQQVADQHPHNREKRRMQLGQNIWQRDQ